MSKKFIFNKEKCINDEGYLFLKSLLGDIFVEKSMEWINDCDGKPCYKKDGDIFCRAKETDSFSYHVKANWCDIIEVEDTEDTENTADDGIKITYIGENKQ